MGRKILVTGNDPELLGFIEQNLGQSGYEISSSREIGEALEGAHKEQRPDLIIVDAMMPWLDGLEVCLRIRQVSPVPLLLLSTWGAGKGEVRAVDLSAEGYLSEPFGGVELRRRVEEALRRAEREAPSLLASRTLDNS